MANDDVRISFAAADAPSELYRNSTGDEAIYLRSGSARFESVYGSIDAAAGDYVVVPRGTIHRWIPSAGSPVHALVIEARGHIRPPRRYLSASGQFLEHAPYCERDLRGPDGPLTAEGEDVPVIVRNRAGLTRLSYAFHPVRRGGLGRLPVPVRVQHRRLRADREAHPRAAAGAPDLRGPQLRDLLVLPAAARLRPRGRADPVQPPQRRLRRDDVLRRRATTARARAQGSGSGRSPCTRPASRTARSPARSRPRSAAWTKGGRPPTRPR